MSLVQLFIAHNARSETNKTKPVDLMQRNKSDRRAYEAYSLDAIAQATQ